MFVPWKTDARFLASYRFVGGVAIVRRTADVRALAPQAPTSQYRIRRGSRASTDSIGSCRWRQRQDSPRWSRLEMWAS